MLSLEHLGLETCPAVSLWFSAIHPFKWGAGIAYSLKKLGYVLDDPEFKIPAGASDFSLL